MTSPNVTPVDADRPVDLKTIMIVATVTLIVGLVLAFTGHERLHSLQRTFTLGGLTLLGFWAMSVAVKTDQGRIRLRSATIGLVVGLLPVGLVGMIALLVS